MSEQETAFWRIKEENDKQDNEGTRLTIHNEARNLFIQNMEALETLRKLREARAAYERACGAVDNNPDSDFEGNRKLSKERSHLEDALNKLRDEAGV